MARTANKQGWALDELKAAWDAADHAIADWRARLQEASIRHRVSELEAVANTWCDRDSVALRKAFATPATTPAGFLAMLHLMKEEDEMFFNQPDDGMQALLHSAPSLFARAAA